MVRPMGMAAGPGGPGTKPRTKRVTPTPMRPVRLFGTGIRYLPNLILIHDTCSGRKSAITRGKTEPSTARHAGPGAQICGTPNKLIEVEAMLAKYGVLKREFMDWAEK